MKKKHNYDECGNIITKKNIFLKKILKRKDKIFESINLNKWFFCLLIIIIFYWTYKLSENNILSIGFTKNLYWLISSLIITALWGWYVHYLSHHISLNETIDLFLDKQSSYLRTFAIYLFDFHDIIHHNTKINKKFINLAIEFILNLLYEGLYLILFLWSMNMGNLIYFKLPILWGLTYASSHVINYTLIEPLCHIQHHNNPYTNFGLDTIDVIMNTKYDINCLENFNHTAINMFLSFLFIEYFL